MPSCEQAATGVAWSTPVRETMRTRFIASGRAAAPEVFGLFAHRVEDYARRLRAARIGTCEATRVRGDQSEAMLDAKMTCLDRRHAELAAAIDVYSGAIDQSLLQRAVSTVAALPRIEDCADSKAMLQAVPMPAGDAERARISAARAALGRARVLRLAARFDEALALATAQLATARTLGFTPLIAEASYELGYVLEQKRADADAERAIREAIQTGAEAHDDVLVAKAWIRLLRIGGVNRQRHAQVDEWLAAARAAVARAGDRPEVLASLEDHYAGVLMQQADFARARDHYQRALELLQRVLPADHPQLASTMNNLGATLVELGELEQGKAALERALASWQRSLGPNHPDVALSLATLGRVFAQSGDLDRAQDYLERSLRIIEATYGRDHVEVSMSLDNLANVLTLKQDFTRARAHLQRSLAITQAALGPDHLDVAASLSSLGTLEVQAGNYAAARDYLVRVLEIRERVSKQSPDLIAPLTNLGTALAELGDSVAGERHIERALAIAETKLGKTHPMVAGTCSHLGELAAQRGDVTRAVAYYTRALAVLRKAYGDDHPDVLATQKDIDRVRQRS
jgi:tetratricopeptide (TPR) repeat protein